MKHITTADALRALEEAVAEKGEDYVYPSGEGCVYVRDGQPSCIAGNALARLGVPIGDLERYNENTGVARLVRALRLPIDTAAFEALDAAQDWQDGRHPWGAALEKARRAVTRHA